MNYFRSGIVAAFAKTRVFASPVFWRKRLHLTFRRRKKLFTALGCGADAELIALCRRCLGPKAEDRPANGQAVADGMTAYLDGVQEKLRKAELAEVEARAKAVEEAKRRRPRLALAATVAVLLLGSVGVAWWQNQQAYNHKTAIH